MISWFKDRRIKQLEADNRQLKDWVGQVVDNTDKELNVRIHSKFLSIGLALIGRKDWKPFGEPK